jgi:hypothetical protein
MLTLLPLPHTSGREANVIRTIPSLTPATRLAMLCAGAVTTVAANARPATAADLMKIVAAFIG